MAYCTHQAKGIDCEALASIFRLSERSQAKNGVWELLAKTGFTHPLRKGLLEFHRTELFEHVVTSLALRLPKEESSNPGILNPAAAGGVNFSSRPAGTKSGKERERSPAPDLESVPPETRAFFAFCVEICSPAEAEYFGGRAGNNNANLQQLVDSAETLLPRFIALVGRDFKEPQITRKILGPGLGRIEKRNPQLSNKTRTVPGCDPTTGNPIRIFISTSGTAVPIDRQVLLEYVSASFFL